MYDIVNIPILSNNKTIKICSNIYEIPKDLSNLPIALTNLIEKSIVDFLLQFIIISVKQNKYYFCNGKKTFNASSFDKLINMVWDTICQHFICQFKNDNFLNIYTFNDGSIFTWKIGNDILPYMFNDMFESKKLYNIIFHPNEPVLNKRKATNMMTIYVNNMFKYLKEH